MIVGRIGSQGLAVGRGASHKRMLPARAERRGMIADANG